MIRILHLSDFHYKESHDADFVSIGKKISEAIEGKQIDLVIFSGDLVFDTNQTHTLWKAAKCLLNPIETTTKLPHNQILIAPGNHDMKRDAEMEMVSQAFSTFNSYQDVDKFASNDGQLNLSLANFENYNQFIKEYYEVEMDVHPLYVCTTVNIKDKKIGLIAFNSAWRSKKSEEDRGKLLFPVFVVKDALSKMNECDLILCNQHHNLSDYTDSVSQEIENLINEKCHILFTGHYHKAGIHTSHDSEIGLLHLVAPAAYNRDDKFSHYGFSIIEFDVDTYEGKIKQYMLHEDSFKVINEKPIAVPVSEKKKELNDFRKLIKRKHEQVVEIADALFVSCGNGSFMTLFKRPIIKNKSVQEIITTRKEGVNFTLENILDSNKSSIIFGYNKRGKTSLLRWLQIHVLNTCVSRKTIPYYIDYKVYKGKKELDLMKNLREYLEKSHQSVKDCFKEYQLLLLIDDLNPTNHDFWNNLLNEMKQFPNSRFIATSAESMSKQCALINFEGSDIDKYYIHNITNREVHQLTLSWPNITIERKKVIEEKIMQITSQMHLSLNYWTISLLLWIFEKTDNTNIHNNFELVQLYIDELLCKDDFIKNQDFAVDYDDLKSYLAEMAKKILYSEEYRLTEDELLDFTREFKKNNLKFIVASWDIIKYLLDQGVIHIIEGKYTIRLKGVFEFLLAYRMQDGDEELLDTILKTKNGFLTFGNELEYYAGFKKNDFDTIETIFNSAKDIMSPLTKHSEYDAVDDRLLQVVTITDKDFQSTGKLIDRLSNTPEEDQYNMLPVQIGALDETVITPKIYLDNVEINASNVEHILFILARIFRNSNACNKPELAKDLFDFILTGTCNLGFLLVDEAKEIEKDDVCQAEQLITLVSNFMPIIIEAFLYDAISQKNLTEVFKVKLNELIENPAGNQLRIFLLTFILVDLDIKSNYKLVQKALAVISNKVLRYAILNKNVLLTIHNYDDKEIIGMLSTDRYNLLKEFGNIKAIDTEVNAKIQNKALKENNMRRIINSDYK